MKRCAKQSTFSEADIANAGVYLANMSKSFPDKAWFLKYVDRDIRVVVDFGGGSGEFCEYVRDGLAKGGLAPEFVVIDNNESFAAAARDRGFLTFPSLGDMLASGRFDFRESPALLIMSSVIHEVYSYATGPADIRGFWRDVARCGFRQIAIRDMSLNFSDFRDVPVDDVCWAYEHVLKDPELTVKGANVAGLLADFEDEWGALCDPAAKKVNVRNFVHFLIKYRYVENWERELRENYLPVTQDALERILEGMGYGLSHKESSRLPFYAKTWAKDFKLRRPDAGGHKARFLAWLETLTTHIKWLAER